MKDQIKKIILLITIISVIIIYMIYHIHVNRAIETFVNKLIDPNFQNIERITSKVDNKAYNVQSKYQNKEAAAHLLADINNTILIFIHELYKKYPNDYRVRRLVKRYPQSVDIIEGQPLNGSTSYSISKGDKLVLCIRSKKDYRLHNKNLVMFVVLHELAHIMSKTYGHNQEFLTNFKFILRNAEEMGIYKKIPFNRQPREYCGMTINTSPI